MENSVRGKESVQMLIFGLRSTEETGRSEVRIRLR